MYSVAQQDDKPCTDRQDVSRAEEQIDPVLREACSELDDAANRLGE